MEGLIYLEQLAGSLGWIVLTVFVLAVIISNIKVVPQALAYVVERLGAFHASWGVPAL